MVDSSTWKSVTLLSAFTLVSFGSVWYGPQPALAGNTPREVGNKPKVDAASAVKRAGMLLELWNRDKSRAHLDEALDVLERARNTNYGKAVVLSWIGHIDILRGDYAQSVPPLKEAVASRPKTPAPYIDLAFALDRLGRSSEAAGYLKSAVPLVPLDNGDKDSFAGKHDLLLRHIYLDLGSVSLRAQQTGDAIQAYRQADLLNRRVASIPTQSRVRMDVRLRDYMDEDEGRIADALGSALRQNRQYNDAITSCDRATTLRPSNGAYWRNLAGAYQSAAVNGKPGEPETARLWDRSASAYARALMTSPNDAALRDQYATALSGAGKHAEAVREFGQAQSMRPASEKATANALFHYGLSEWQAGNAAHATELFQQSAALDPSRPQALQWQGFASLNAQDATSAIDPLVKAAKLEPNSIATHLDLGTAYLQTQQRDLALAQFQKVVDLQPNSLEGNYALGRTLFDLRRYAEAAKAFRKADELLANRSSAQQVVLFGKGDARLSREDLQHALAYSLELAGDLAGAAEVHERPIGGSAVSARMAGYAAAERYRLARIEPSDANWDRAEQALARVAQRQSSAYILESYGDVLHYRKKDREAAPQYARALELSLKEVNPDPEASLFALREKYAETLRNSDRDEEAIKQLEASVTHDPSPYSALVVLGALYQKQARLATAHVDRVARDGWLTKAESVYKKALEAPLTQAAANVSPPPAKIEIRRALAPIQYTLAKYDDAGSSAAAILMEDPKDLNAAIIRYKYLFERKHDSESARMALETALSGTQPPADEPSRRAYQTAARAVAFQYLQRKPQTAANLHEASAYYDRALEVQPNDSETLNGKGIVAMQRKDYQAAVEQFTRAVKADSTNGIAYNNLGEAYEHLKGDHFADTLQSYKRAYQEMPNVTAVRQNLERYSKYAKFGWEPREHLTPYASIPMYHSRGGPATMQAHRGSARPTMRAHRRRKSPIRHH